MAVIELKGLRYSYPLTDDPALQYIDLSVAKGEFVGLVGPNGSGKSTLCYVISGFVPHFFQGELTGEAVVAGLETNQVSLSDMVLKVGLAFQNPFNQISGSKFTVFEEVAFGLENTGVPRDEMVERVEEGLKLTGISDLGGRSPYSLSGGQQQRVALASILVMEPEILVLDEPTSQLDPIGTREVFEVIRGMSDRGITVVMAEHKTEWIAEFADRVIALKDGSKILDGSPQSVLTSEVLIESGTGISRYTSTAIEARQTGLWPDEVPLPVTLAQAARGFGKGIHADKN
jgi:energy-coupling factor transporter ATP-binding protein EcfA2